MGFRVLGLGFRVLGFGVLVLQALEVITLGFRASGAETLDKMKTRSGHA